MTDDLDMLVAEPSIDVRDILPTTTVTVDSNLDALELSSTDSPYTLSLRRKEFADEKELTKFINSCERMIRCSPEYRVWTEYIREVLGMHVCEISGEVHSQTTVEIHHHPFTLYMLTKSVIMKHLEEDSEFCAFDIAIAVIQLHYEMRAPFCMIVKSLHEKFHKGFLQIPITLVQGDFRYLISHYLHYLDDDDSEMVTSRLGITNDNCGWDGQYWLKEKE